MARDSWKSLLTLLLSFQADFSRASESVDFEKGTLITFDGRRAVADRNPLRILPVGDSITEGYQSTDDNGYREDLYNDLSASGTRSITFIGNQRFGNATGPWNHFEGYGGLRIAQIQSKLLASGSLFHQFNVVLLLAGTNDVIQRPDTDGPYAKAPTRLGELMANIICAAPKAVLLVAKIPQLANATYQARVETFNAAIPPLATRFTNLGFKVAIVDNSDVGPPNLVYDGIHPNDNGYNMIAQNWYEVLQGLPSGWIEPPSRTLNTAIQPLSKPRALCSSLNCSGSWQCWWQNLQAQARIKQLRLSSFFRR